MNLKPMDRSELTGDVLTMIIRGWVAWDKCAGVHMGCSRGRRMTGRPRRYFVAYDDCFCSSFHLTAESDEIAIEKANKRLAAGALFHHDDCARKAAK